MKSLMQKREDESSGCFSLALGNSRTGMTMHKMMFMHHDEFAGVSA